MSRILLISPPITTTKKTEDLFLHEPLGLSYLAAVLEKKNYDVQILDCYALGLHVSENTNGYVRYGLKEDQIVAELKNSSPDIVGVTCNFTAYARDSFRVAQIAKRILPSSLVVIGGAHVTMCPLESIEDRNVDIVVKGEGEYTFLELVKNYYEGKDFHHVLGTVTKKNGRIIDNPNRPLIDDLDSLPFPARHLLRMDIYLKDQTRTIYPFAMATPVGFVVSSRGCPYNCIFCSTAKVWRRYRSRSCQNVIDEIELLIKKYGIREVAFQDDCFLRSQEWVFDLCNELIRRNLKIKWSVPPGLTVWNISKKLLRIMEKSGFYHACFPIESGSRETLKFIRKPVNLEKVKEAITDCNKIGIWTYANFIIGFPYERMENIRETIEYALNSELDMIKLHIAQPHRGSDMYEIYMKEGLLPADKAALSAYYETAYPTKYFTASELNKIRQEAMSKFVKKRIFRVFTPKGFLNLTYKLRTREKLFYFIKICYRLLVFSIKYRKLSLIT